MGLYYRKSKSVGPFRFNVSKSGVGVSTGVKGARVSLGSRGAYINLGKNGIYYRKKLGSFGKNNSRSANRRSNQGRNSYTPGNQGNDVMEDNVIFRDGADNESLINETVKKASTIYAFVFVFWVALCIVLAFFIKLWIIPVAIITRILLNILLPINLNYDLDEEAADEWNAFCDELYEMKYNKKLWIVDSSSNVWNTKTNAGASRNVSRSTAKIKRRPVGSVSLDFIRTDVPCIVIDGFRYNVLFLPSDIIISRNGNAVAFPYSQVTIRDSSTSFVEYGKVEKDAYVTGYTHQYVNKNGSADLRYKNNPEIPVCRYGTVRIEAGNNLRIELQTSNDETVNGIGKAFRYYNDYYVALEQRAPIDKSRKKPVQIISQDYEDETVLDTLYKLKHLIIDSGNNAKGVIETILSCDIDLIDGAQHNGEGIVLYEASERVDYRIEELQRLFDEKYNANTKNKFIFEPVSENSFLAHILFEFKNVPVELELSDELYDALDAANGYEIVLEKVYPKSRTDEPDPPDETNSASFKDSPAEVAYTKEQQYEGYEDYSEELPMQDDAEAISNNAYEDPYGDLFNIQEPDDASEINKSGYPDLEQSLENKKVDDIMDFFE